MEQVVGSYLRPYELEESIDLFGSNKALGVLRDEVIALLEGHPRPFRKRETVEVYAGIMQELIENLKVRWPDRTLRRLQELQEACQAWPPETLPEGGSLILALGDMKPLSRAKIRRARERLKETENPLGKHAIALTLHTHDMMVRSRYETSAHLEATRIVLALRIASTPKQGLPGTIEALVEAGTLPGLPLDPFSGKPFLYSKRRRLLWSVGEDGKDQGGDEEKDLVWRIPRWE